MKTFKINRNSWHYKLNRKFFNTWGDNEYYMQDSWEPKHNNFCAYWRATMFRAIWVIFLAVFAGICLFAMGIAAYQHPWDTLIVVGSVISIIAFLVFGIALSETIEVIKSKREEKAAPESLFVQRYRAYKSKVCPMVEYD